MNYRQLGSSDLYISPVGVGTAPLGSTPTWRIYWGNQPEAESIAAIHAALDLGINWIDTAPFYGWGRAEEIVGKALQGRRDQALIFTKCGSLPGGEDGWALENLTPASIRQEVEASLRRLQTDHIDLLQFHDPDPNVPMEDSWGEVERLIQAGKVRYGGLSNHPVELMARAHQLMPVTSTQNQYNLLRRQTETEILPWAGQHQVGVLAWAPLASGFLLDSFDLSQLDPHDFRHQHPFASPERYPDVEKLQLAIKKVAERHGKSSSDVCIAWVLRQTAVTGAIIGIRNPAEAQAMLGGVDWSLTAEDISTLEAALPPW